MKIDLHLHTKPRSQCSYINPAELVPMALKKGLDGICLTEHQVLWDIDEVRELAGDSGLKIFRGNEITTAQGDVLVFGLEKDIQGIITIQELQREVLAAGAYSIIAHPFRGFKTFGVADLHMSVEQAARKKALQFVNAVEIKNGKVTDMDNDLARQVAEKLGLRGTGGSDAHNIDDVGRYYTTFEQDIETDQQLVEALHSGQFQAADGR